MIRNLATVKYYFDPSFNVVNKNRYANLIKYLFLHYDQFVAELVGKNFKKSVYRNVIYPTVEFEYWLFRRQRAHQYKEYRRLGYPYKVKRLVSLERFKLRFIHPVINNELSCLKLYIHVMSEIFNFSSIVHDGNGKCFKLAGNGSQFFRSVISDIIRERFPNIDLEGEDGPFVCSTYLPTTSIDVPQFIPVYMFIFKLLKKKKLDFKHVVFTAESFPELTEFFTTLSAELEIEKILTSVPSTLDEDDIERAVYNLEESKKHAEVKELLELPPIVVAYYNVYGHLPAN